MAAELGVMPDQFWRMSYAEWLVYSRGRQDANRDADDKARLYFREMFALTYNIHRGEKDSPISGADVIPLSGEKVERRQTSVDRAKALAKQLADPNYSAFMMKRFNSTPEEWAEYCKTDPWAIKRIAWEKKQLAKEKRQKQQ